MFRLIITLAMMMGLSAAATAESKSPFSWSGIVPLIPDSPITRPVEIKSEELEENLAENPYLTIDTQKTGIFDNQYGKVMIVSINI